MAKGYVKYCKWLKCQCMSKAELKWSHSGNAAPGTFGNQSFAVLANGTSADFVPSGSRSGQRQEEAGHGGTGGQGQAVRLRQ